MFGHHHQYRSPHVHSARMAAILGAAIVLTWAMCAPRKLSGQVGFTGPGRYQIVNASSGRIVVVDREDGSTVRQVRDDGDRDAYQQTWDITAARIPGYFIIRSSITGNVLEATGSRRSMFIRAARFDGGRDQLWRIDSDRNGNAVLISQFGRPLELPGGEPSAFTLRPAGQQSYYRDDRERREGQRRDMGGPPEIIPAGTSLSVRTNEYIRADARDNRVYTGVVEQEVLDQNGRLAIPRGSTVELLVRTEPDGDLILDMDSVTVNGQRYGLAAQAEIERQRREGVGGNRRTGEYVGGGAVLGAILGAIAGGGKGAAIGAAGGAAAGAGAQIFTRGRSIQVPAESIVTFQLQQPLQIGAADRGYNREGRHYHPEERYR